MAKFNLWTEFKKILGKVGLQTAETELLNEEKVDIEAALKNWYASNPELVTTTLNGFKAFLPFIQAEAAKKDIKILNDEITTIEAAIDEFLASI